ncbi:MAG: PQQ-binding-like beta-propeller repeat protein [Spirochaetaceae bacterium]|nr:MAG: PQQ-binding-like beta-propeller repeat protein [Spirochaetaceae bacterium]
MRSLFKQLILWLSRQYRFFSWMIVAAVSGLAIVGLIWWLSRDPTSHFLASIPGMDGAPSRLEQVGQAVRIGEFFRLFEAAAAKLPGSWPRFRGARSDNISEETVDLTDWWGPDGPEILWTVELGEGHAAPAVLDGRVYVLDYDEQQKADALRCFSLANGQELWRRWYTVQVKRNHGMSRTVPAVNDRYVVSIGPRCHVMCLDSRDGSFKWGIDLERDYGSEVPLWYTAQCPLLDGDTAVLAPGGEQALLIGVDCRSGDVLWKTPNPSGWGMSHSSIMTMSLNGRRMYIYCAIGGVVGVSAEQGDRGALLWQTSAWSPKVVAPSPVVLEGGRIFLTAGYGAGSLMLQVNESNGIYSVTPLYSYRPHEGLACEQQTPLLYQGHLFGILPKDGGELRNQFVCFHPDGRILWSSGVTNRFGLGPFMAADGKFFILGDDGVLTMARATTESFQPLATAKVLDGRDPWGPLAIAGGRMLLRDSTQMVCIDLRAGQ